MFIILTVDKVYFCNIPSDMFVYTLRQIVMEGKNNLQILDVLKTYCYALVQHPCFVELECIDEIKS